MGHRELLKGAALFHDLSEEELSAIHAIVEHVNLVGGDPLFLAGSVVDAIYVIDMGTVELRLAGHDKAFLRYGSGQMVGVGALLGDEPRPTAATAVEVCRLLRIPLAPLRRLLDERPGLAIKVYRNAARYFAHHATQMAAELERPYF